MLIECDLRRSSCPRRERQFEPEISQRAVVFSPCLLKNFVTLEVVSLITQAYTFLESRSQLI
jgi:hypothetical protein